MVGGKTKEELYDWCAYEEIMGTALHPTLTAT